jgi:hypothetical protein
LAPWAITIAGIFRGGRPGIVEIELSIADIEEIDIIREFACENESFVNSALWIRG